MIFLLESVVLCALFTLTVPVGLMRNPIDGIMSYPPAIRKRVENLTQYQGSIRRTERKHIGKKIAACLFMVAILVALCWFSGHRSFGAAFLYGFALFTTVNLWDLIAVDWLWFCRSKKVRLPGTEDMVREYHDPWFHLLGFGKGCIIGAAISALSSVLVALI